MTGESKADESLQYLVQVSYLLYVYSYNLHVFCHDFKTSTIARVPNRNQ